MINNSTDKTPSIGDSVRFYDSQTAHKENDHSGSNPRYYPIGKVISVYDYKSPFGYTDEVCDIQIGDRISTAHFTNCVEIIN